MDNNNNSNNINSRHGVTTTTQERQHTTRVTNYRTTRSLTLRQRITTTAIDASSMWVSPSTASSRRARAISTSCSMCTWMADASARGDIRSLMCLRRFWSASLPISPARFLLYPPSGRLSSVSNSWMLGVVVLRLFFKKVHILCHTAIFKRFKNNFSSFTGKKLLLIFK